MYNSSRISKSCQLQFTQEHPRFNCRNVSQRQAIQDSLGLDYLPKCRNPRCSHECYQHWAKKESASVDRHLHNLTTGVVQSNKTNLPSSEPPRIRTYRGNLTLQKNA